VSGGDIARWLGELAKALEEAQELVNCLAVAEGGYIEILDVCARLEAARAEVQSLRRSGTRETRPDIDRKWHEHVLWDRALPVPRA
jgi:hypothetical protein